MITAAEAQKLTEDSVTEEQKASLLKDVDHRIKTVAEAGQSFLKIEGLNDAKTNYLRQALSKYGYEVSDIGLTIYW